MKQRNSKIKPIVAAGQKTLDIQKADMLIKVSHV
jgi:hypothetical protein